MFDITFKNVTATSKGLYVVRRPNIPAAEPVFEPYEIPGRDGYLMPDDITYAPIEIEVELNFMSSTPTTWADVYRGARAWLYGSGRLIFSDDPDYFYKVYEVRIDSPERSSRRIGTFTAVFICDPHQYYKLTGYTIENNVSSIIINNPHLATYPIYTLHRPTTQTLVTLVVNGHVFSVPSRSKINPEVGVVTDLSNGSILNRYTEGNFEDLILLPGNNTVTYSNPSGLDAVIIEVYWRLR